MFVAGRQDLGGCPARGSCFGCARGQSGASGDRTASGAGVAKNRGQVPATRTVRLPRSIAPRTEHGDRWPGSLESAAVASASNDAVHRSIGARRHRASEAPASAPLAGDRGVGCEGGSGS
jgi:hypothetical protein